MVCGLGRRRSGLRNRARSIGSVSVTGRGPGPGCR